MFVRQPPNTELHPEAGERYINNDFGDDEGSD